MTLTLDAQLEQRIQSKIEAGSYHEPSDVISRALDLLDEDESWSEEEKIALDQRLTESAAQIQRGEGIPGDKLPEILAQLRTARRG